MKFLRDLPVRRKVATVILAASIGTLFLASTSMLGVEWYRSRAMLVRDLQIQARILASNSSASVVFDDGRTGAELLGALKAKPHLVHASLRRLDHSLLAEFHAEHQHRAPIGDLPLGAYRFADNYLVVLEPVTLNGVVRGSLQLEFDFGALQWEIVAPFVGLTGCVSLASLVFTLLFAARMQRWVTVPILKLSATASHIAEHHDYSARAEKLSRDEIGALTDSFNHMLNRIQAADGALRQAHEELGQQMAERQRLTRELVEISHRAGMAEVATGVLHNVGNVLNSVNVSASLVQEQLDRSELRGLLRAADLLREHQSDLIPYLTEDPRGRHLPDFIIAISTALAAEQARWRDELQVLVRHITHIKEIVAMQQSYARVSGVIERLSPRELAEDAIRMNRAALDRDRVTLEPDFKSTPEVSVDKHKVLQILVNLLQNARRAVADRPPGDRRILVSISSVEEQHVAIAVADNGIGIPPENLARIFSHGFTTRKNGHGFGLHMGALAAKQLGGSLVARSAGVGRGACFTLELPVEPPPSALA